MQFQKKIPKRLLSFVTALTTGISAAGITSTFQIGGYSQVQKMRIAMMRTAFAQRTAMALVMRRTSQQRVQLPTPVSSTGLLVL